MQAASPPERLFGGRIAPSGRVASRLGSKVEAPGDLLRQGRGYDLFNGGPILFGGLGQSPPLVGAVADRQVLADQVTEFDSCFAPILEGLKKWPRHQFPTLSQERNRDAAVG
jgi:hypothetical protein